MSVLTLLKRKEERRNDSRAPSRFVLNRSQYGVLTRREVLTNIWFLRCVMMISMIVVSSLLLLYSFIFLNTFETFGNTTSYFPWYYHVFLTNPGPVLTVFVYNSVGSLVMIGAALLLLSYFKTKFQIAVNRTTSKSVWSIVFRQR